MAISAKGSRMIAMIVQLGIEPRVQGDDELRIVTGVTDLSASVDRLVLNNKPLVSHHQLVQPRHVRSMDHLRIVEITSGETDGLFS